MQTSNSALTPKTWWGILINGILIAVVFYPAFAWMTVRFLENDSSYSHGFLVPIISAVLIWQKKEQLRALSPQSSSLGLPLVCLGLALHILGGVIFNIGFVSAVAFVLSLLGFSLYLFGTAVTRVILFPLLFLMVMIPIPKVVLLEVTFKLKMIAAHIASIIVGWMHLSVTRAGSIFYTPQGSLIVENECSGINSLISMATLSILFAYFTRGEWYRKAVLVLASIPIAVAANVVRITVLVLIGYVYGIEAAMKGMLHYGAGVILWVVALVMFSFLWRVVQWQRA